MVSRYTEKVSPTQEIGPSVKRAEIYFTPSPVTRVACVSNVSRASSVPVSVGLIFPVTRYSVASSLYKLKKSVEYLV